MSDIQIGDKVTYKKLNSDVVMTVIVEDDQEIIYYTQEPSNIEILKIERPKYEVIEEKKELLTEEEREFLRLYLKFFPEYKIDYINKQYGKLNFEYGINNLRDTKKCDCPISYFKNLMEGRQYTLSELRIGGITVGR